MIMITITKSRNSLEVRKQNVCTYKDIIYITMRNVKVIMIIMSIY
jgi:PHD/YefM family antitoxin component YafN of YafNO toxin-antitoxin module